MKPNGTFRKEIALAIFLTVFFASCSHSAEEVPWHMALSNGGGWYWRYRTPVDIENRGKSDLVGFPVLVSGLGLNTIEHPRVVRADGVEVLYGDSWDLSEPHQDKDGNTVRSVQKTLYLPVEAKAGETVRYYVYGMNPRDGWSGIHLPKNELFERRPRVENAGFGEPAPDDIYNEIQPGYWQFDQGDEKHRIFWSSKEVRKNDDCCDNRNVKVEVDAGAERSWIAARQSGIAVRPGMKYRLSGWVKGENIVGQAGFYVHICPEGKPFTISPMAVTDEKDFDWKKVEVEFTTPDDAAEADLGTVLYGTGTAWYDDISLDMIDMDRHVEVHVGRGEQCPLKLYPDSDNFEVHSSADNHRHPYGYEARSSFRIVNLGDTAIEKPIVLFDLRSSYSHGRIGLPYDILVQDSNRVRLPGELVDPVTRQAQATLTSIPPKSINIVHVYYKFDEESAKTNADPNVLESVEGTAHPELQQKFDAFAALPNLLQNGGFENEGGWEGEGTVETDPAIVRFGKACGRLDMMEKDTDNWRGFRQTISVEPGRNYRVSGWLRCEDCTEGARIHVHFYQADGSFCKENGTTSVEQGVHGTSDWTYCSQMFVAPKDAARMSIHLTAHRPGTIWHDNIMVVDSLPATFLEAKSYYPPPGWIQHPNPYRLAQKEQEARKKGLVVRPNPDPKEYEKAQEEHEKRYASRARVWQVPAVMKVFPESIPPEKPERVVRIGAARNEKEPLQIATREYPMATLRISELVDEKGNKLPEPEIFTVGYVPVDYPTNYYNLHGIPDWYRKTPNAAPGCDGWAGLWPDPLIPGRTPGRYMQNTGGTNAFWILWSIPKDAAPGLYRGTLTVWGRVGYTSEQGEDELPIELTVYDFTLPDKSGISAIYDARFTGPTGIWGDDPYRKGVELMTENRLAPDVARPEPELQFTDGKPVFDWTEFDRTAERLLNERKVRHLYMPWYFYLFGWGHPPKEFYGEQPYEGEWPFKDADRSKLRPEYKAKFQAALREFWNHVKEKGWADRFVYYISDEPNHWEEPILRQMIALCEMVHEVDPKIPIYCSTWGFVPEWLDSLDIWGIGHYGIVPPETMQKILDHGSRIWFTTDGMQCLDTPYCAIERLLPHYCFKYGAEAYEFWGIGWLTVDPWRYGFHEFIRQSSTPGEHYWVRYPNGDGYLLYPRISKNVFRFSDMKNGAKNSILRSIRFEQAREGVEDYEYLRLLKERIEKNPDHPAAPEARKALEEMTSLVDCPTAIGRYSTRILPNPRRLDVLRDKVARAIESLDISP